MSLVPQKNSSIYFLIIANLIPLVGVIFFGWNLFSILIAYWLENIVIGIFTVFKIMMAEGTMFDANSMRIFNQMKTFAPQTVKIALPKQEVSILSRIATTLFFIVHFGIFTIGHGIFIFALASNFYTSGIQQSFSFSVTSSSSLGLLNSIPVTFWSTLIIVLSLFVSHGISFFTNFIGQQEYKNISPDKAMNSPYGRVAVMHIVVIAVTIVFGKWGFNTFSVVIIILLKGGLDCLFHIRQHLKKNGSDPKQPNLKLSF